MNRIKYTLCLTGLAVSLPGLSQQTAETADSLVLSNSEARIVFQSATGKIHYRFSNGTTMENTVGYMDDLRDGFRSTADFSQHRYSVEAVSDSLGEGKRVLFVHFDDRSPYYLVQSVTMYAGHPYILLQLTAERVKGENPETRHMAPLAVLPGYDGRFFLPGSQPRILDVPFDNDNWVNVLPTPWPAAGGKQSAGISYELAGFYDRESRAGLVAGSVVHDFWKTGIRYKMSAGLGQLDSLVVYGGAATPDNPSLPAAYGGYDGTHDYVLHGTAAGPSVSSPLIYLGGVTDVRNAFVQYGKVHEKLHGRLSWKGYAPFYWNSFGVEGVLGYSKVMMPPGVTKISDFLHGLDHFNAYAQPVLSIDSYDQNIYTTEMLASIGRYGKKRKQQMGFYFIPFAIWTWSNGLTGAKLGGTDYVLDEVILKDNFGQPIPYKKGDWAAYPLDPTHPATRAHIIHQLQKAKAINATFLKIDFLSAGALEASLHYDRSVRTGMQAYSGGMKMLKSLVDSILGPDIFITMAISPMFPHQYAHTRFISTDVYSHLRDDQPGFPHYGSTQASLANGSHYWWMQGTLWPYTNLDVAIMKNFQKNPDLTEQEIKVRLYAMMAMGSILGDGSDFRNELAAGRARKFLNHKDLCAFFSNPRAFTPLQAADGESKDQQLAFVLKGDTTLLGLFNFDTVHSYEPRIPVEELGEGEYLVRDFFSGHALGRINKEQAVFSITVPPKDALMVQLIPVK